MVKQPKKARRRDTYLKDDRDQETAEVASTAAKYMYKPAHIQNEHNFSTSLLKKMNKLLRIMHIRYMNNYQMHSG